MRPAILPTKPTGLRRTCVLDYPWVLLLFAIMPLIPSFFFFRMLIHHLFLCIAFALGVSKKPAQTGFGSDPANPVPEKFRPHVYKNQTRI